MESMDATMYEPPVLPEGAALCVLASGSAGNCSVLLLGEGNTRRACLIDLGLSPRKTWRLLASLGIEPYQVDSMILTHLDADHLHRGWLKEGACPGHVTVRAHYTHARVIMNTGIAEAGSLGRSRLTPYEDGFSLAGDGECRVHMASHDEEGVSVFRFELSGMSAQGRSLGFATDVGCITAELIDHLAGVDVLAIESNYCPKMQEASGRPEFLKQRIMGGSGHLSNFQALTAIGHIAPSLHVVLLHLSQDCNHPDVVAQMHEGADYAWTIAGQSGPTRWIGLGARAYALVEERSPGL